MIGTAEEFEKLACTGCDLVIDCQSMTAFQLKRIVSIARKNGGKVTLTKIRTKSMQALIEIALEGKSNVVLDTR